jgi:hypothetical protein
VARGLRLRAVMMRSSCVGALAALVVGASAFSCGGRSEHATSPSASVATAGGGQGGAAVGGGAGVSGTGGSAGTGSSAGSGGGVGTGGSVGAAGPGPACGASTPGNCDGATSYMEPHGSCVTEGASCQGHVFHDARTCNDWWAICCNAEWSPISGGTPAVCPAPLEPGEPFPCGIGGETCIAGETYCHIVQQQPPTCVALCEAGDCSCFCMPDATGGCAFDLPNQESLDECRCVWPRSDAGPRQAGGVVVDCSY